MNLVINTDGASRGNPGRAGFAFIIRDEDGVILHQEGGVLGEATNNVAEYTAVARALEYIVRYFQKKAPLRVKIFTDSQLIAQQLKGGFRVKNQVLKDLLLEIKNLEAKAGEVVYIHIPREQNFIADRLVNQALDKQDL